MGREIKLQTYDIIEQTIGLELPRKILRSAQSFLDGRAWVPRGQISGIDLFDPFRENVVAAIVVYEGCCLPRHSAAAHPVRSRCDLSLVPEGLSQFLIYQIHAARLFDPEAQAHIPQAVSLRNGVAEEPIAFYFCSTLRVAACLLKTSLIRRRRRGSSDERHASATSCHWTSCGPLGRSNRRSERFSVRTSPPSGIFP